MHEELKKLYDCERDIENEVKVKLGEYARELVSKLKNKKIDDKKFRAEISEIIRGTKDIVPVYRLLVGEAEKQGIKINAVKIELAKRLVEEAKSGFLAVPVDELSEAADLFEKTGLKEESQKCKELIGSMFGIAEDNEEKLE